MKTYKKEYRIVSKTYNNGETKIFPQFRHKLFGISFGWYYFLEGDETMESVVQFSEMHNAKNFIAKKATFVTSTKIFTYNKK